MPQNLPFGMVLIWLTPPQNMVIWGVVKKTLAAILDHIIQIIQIIQINRCTFSDLQWLPSISPSSKALRQFGHRLPHRSGTAAAAGPAAAGGARGAGARGTEQGDARQLLPVAADLEIDGETLVEKGGNLGKIGGESSRIDLLKKIHGEYLHRLVVDMMSI